MMAIREEKLLQMFHLIYKMNPALTQWIQDQKIKLFNMLRATALQPRAGKPRRGTDGRTTTDLELGQTWDEVGTKLGRHE